MRRTKIKLVSSKQAKRNRKLAAIKPPDDGLCQKCRQLPDFRGLQRAHKKRRSDGTDDRRSNIVWLCAKCHIDNGHLGEREQIKAKPSKPAPLQLAGYHTQFRPFSRDEQCGRKK